MSKPTEGRWRRTYVAVENCPLSKDMSLEACKKCPNFIEYWAWKRWVHCKLLSGLEEKMKPEPDSDKEYITKW